MAKKKSKEETPATEEKTYQAMTPKLEEVTPGTARLICAECGGNVTLDHVTQRDGCFEIDTECKTCGTGLLRIIKGEGKTYLEWLK